LEVRLVVMKSFLGIRSVMVSAGSLRIQRNPPCQCRNPVGRKIRAPTAVFGWSVMEEMSRVEDSIAVWEGEGGTPSRSAFRCTSQAALHAHLRPEHTSFAEQMTGTVNQIEWAV
jgi:hypothetical protein